MIRYLSILLLTIFSTQASAEWTSDNTAWESAFVAAAVIDWGQTRDLSRQPAHKEYYECNSILGNNPSVGKIDKYFSAFILGHLAISYVIPDEYRKTWQVLTAISQIAIVVHNNHFGLKVDF